MFCSLQNVWKGPGVLSVLCTRMIHKGECEKEWWRQEAGSCVGSVKWTSCRGCSQNLIKTFFQKTASSLGFNAFMARPVHVMCLNFTEIRTGTRLITKILGWGFYWLDLTTLKWRVELWMQTTAWLRTDSHAQMCRIRRILYRKLLGQVR